MKKYLLNIFLFAIILFLTPQVFALDYNVSNQITSPVAPSNAGTYTGEEQNGSTSSWNINTRYQGTLQRIRYNIPLPSGWLDGQCFAIGNTYTITMNMATNDWRNYFGTVRVIPYSSYSGNWSNGRVNFISRKKISFTFTIPDTYTSCVDFIYVDLPSNAIFTPFTGETNWNLSSIILTDPMYTSGGGSSGGSSGGSTNQDIINNNTQNTENIINNQNDNTSNIIENNNQNTQNIIDNQKELLSDCLKNDISLNYVSLGGRSYNYPLNLLTGKTYNISTNAGIAVCIHNGNFNCVNELIFNNYGGGSYSSNYDITATSNSLYLSISFGTGWGNYDITSSETMLSLGSGRKSFVYYGEEKCNSKIDNTTNAINETNDYLKDDSDPNISDSEFTDLFDTVGFNDPLGYLLQLPVQFINQLVSQSNSCQTISLGTLWGVSLSMPCINIGSIIGQQVWDIIDVLFSVGLLVVIFKNLYQTFANLMTMGGEKEAREKFSMPTPMEFLSMILGGDK